MKKLRAFLTREHIAMIVISIILLQTLPFKFLGLQESVEIFTKLDQEPRGRIGSGVLELLGTIGLRIPATKKYAAIGISLLMIGALYFHATVLGRNQLALMAAITLVCSVFVIFKKNK